MDEIEMDTFCCGEFWNYYLKNNYTENNKINKIIIKKKELQKKLKQNILIKIL